MDGHGNIEDRRQALVRVLAALVAMAGSSATVARALRNAVLRLLRPAESATRRLVVALAQGLAVTLRRRPAAKPLSKLRQYQPLMPPEPAAPRREPVSGVLPLLDASRRFGSRHGPRRTSVPSISFCMERHPIPPLPSPRDRLDATRLTFRLDALEKTLANLPRQALRCARWRARQALLLAAGDRGRAALRRPLRFGPPPGSKKRGPRHEVHEILAFTNSLALEALSDTS